MVSRFHNLNNLSQICTEKKIELFDINDFATLNNINGAYQSFQTKGLAHGIDKKNKYCTEKENFIKACIFTTDL